MKFTVGDRVEVVRAEEKDMRKYIGEVGMVVFAPRDYDDFYNVALDGDDEIEFYESELELE
jgi:hypothetical protein